MQDFKTYLVTMVPSGVWRKLKARAERENIKIRDLFRRWIQDYADGK